jgi:hypothetical protein
LVQEIWPHVSWNVRAINKTKRTCKYNKSHKEATFSSIFLSNASGVVSVLPGFFALRPRRQKKCLAIAMAAKFLQCLNTCVYTIWDTYVLHMYMYVYSVRVYYVYIYVRYITNSKCVVF